MSALSKFIEVFSKQDLLFDIGPVLNCVEADALADFLKSMGEPEAVQALLESHAESDDEGDKHWKGKQ